MEGKCSQDQIGGRSGGLYPFNPVDQVEVVIERAYSGEDVDLDDGGMQGVSGHQGRILVKEASRSVKLFSGNRNDLGEDLTSHVIEPQVLRPR